MTKGSALNPPVGNEMWAFLEQFSLFQLHYIPQQQQLNRNDIWARPTQSTGRLLLWMNIAFYLHIAWFLPNSLRPTASAERRIEVTFRGRTTLALSSTESRGSESRFDQQWTGHHCSWFSRCTILGAT